MGLGSSSFSAKLLESFKDKNGDVSKADEEFTLAQRIPGMLKPSQLEDKDEDI